MNMNEKASYVTRNMIDMLLHVHALCNMHRATNDDEFRKTAVGWIEPLEREFSFLKSELMTEIE